MNRRHVYFDDEGNVHEYYTCSGHKHLYVTVTTYYFEQLYRCKLSKYPVSSGYAGSIIGSSTVEKVWNTLINAGYTEQAVAGAIGNLMYESGGGPNDINLHAVEGGYGEGIGMVQWSFDRKQKFLDFLESRGAVWPNTSADLQIEFMMMELANGEWDCWEEQYGSQYDVPLSTFKNCTDITAATWYWCACYERCWYSSSHMDIRIQYAKNVYNTYHGKDMGETLPEGADLTALGDFLITYYCPCTLCSEGYGTQTATGATCRANHTIAVDPSVIPYGSKVLINGIV